MRTPSLQVSRGWLHSLKIAALVGTVLTGIHQADLIRHVSFSHVDMFRLLLNYLVPFLVASYARGLWRSVHFTFAKRRVHNAAECGFELGAEFTVQHVPHLDLARNV